MDKETFYKIMGWEDDEIQPWERWGLVGPTLKPPSSESDILTYIIISIIFIVLGALAVRKSWRYNSHLAYATPPVIDGMVRKPKKVVHLVTKIIYAVVAFYFGPIYLLIEAISDRDALSKIMQVHGLIPRLEEV